MTGAVASRSCVGPAAWGCPASLAPRRGGHPSSCHWQPSRWRTGRRGSGRRTLRPAWSPRGSRRQRCGTDGWRGEQAGGCRLIGTRSAHRLTVTVFMASIARAVSDACRVVVRSARKDRDRDRHICDSVCPWEAGPSARLPQYTHTARLAWFPGGPYRPPPPQSIRLATTSTPTT